MRVVRPACAGVVEAGDTDTHAHVVCGLRILVENAECCNCLENLSGHVLGALPRRLWEQNHEFLTAITCHDVGRASACPLKDLGYMPQTDVALRGPVKLVEQFKGAKLV